MAFTVTATESGASAQHGVALLVRVLTNATEAGGAAGGAASGGVTSQGSLTPNFSSSYIAFSISADNVTSMPAAAASNTYDLTTGNASDVWSTAQGHYTGTVTASTPLTYGAGSAGASDHSNWCAYEIPASGGTITLDGSSPAGVLSGSGLASGTAATTASFTPPVGAVLVAEVCAGGSGSGAGVTVTMTDTSGLGLVWTRRAISSTSDNFQPTYVFTATVPATFTGIGGSQQQILPGRAWLRRFRRPQLTEPHEVPAPPVPVYPPQQYAQPGLAWKQKYRLPQRPKPVAPVNPPYIAGLAGGTSGHFVDQFGQPRLYFATVPWGMPANAGRWNSGDWRSDFDQYFADIKAQGMTAAEMHPWGHSHTGCNNDLGNTWDGVSPWTSLPALNNTFWQRIDVLLSTALTHGITVFLVLNMQCDMGVDAFSGTGVFNGVSAANVQAACQNIAARYAAQPNLIFFQGDDYNNDDDTRMQAMVNGLQAGGYTGPTGTEEYSSGTTSRRDLSGSPTGTPFTFGGANSTFNWCYYYAQTYFAVEFAYQENNQIPVVWGDGFYVGGGGGEPSDTHLMRNFVWWALASGARGVGMGSEAIHPWPSGVFTVPVDGITTNAWYNGPAKAVYTAFTGLTGWQNLLPDLTNALVTAGRGSRSAYSATNFQAANLGTDNYVAASITPDGSLAVIYCAVAMSITIDQTKLGAGYTATWLDPASGAATPTATGSTYASSGLGNNSAGNADWVLVLQGPALTSPASVTGTGAPVPAAGGAGALSASANITGTAAHITAASPAGTFAGAAATSGTGAPVTAASPGGTLSAAGNVTGIGAPVTAAGGTGAPSSAVSITGTGAPVTVAAPAGVAAGSSPNANVTGAGALVTVAGGTGTTAGGGSAPGAAAPVTVAGGTGALSSSGNVTGIGAPVTVAAPAGVTSAAANVTGTAAAVTVAGGTGTAFGGTSGAANVAGVAATVTVASPAGVPHSASALTGAAAPVTTAGGTGTASVPASVTGAAAHITTASPAGAAASGVNVTGTGAPVLTAATAGALSAAANLSGLAALATVLGGGGSAVSIVKASSTASVTATGTSAATVSDPRDGTASVAGATSSPSVS